METAVHLQFTRVVRTGNQHEGTAEDSDFYANLLRACGNVQDLSRGRQVHRSILGSEHHRSRYLQNLLMEMYGKCGSPEEARTVFDEICQKNCFSWNIMMAAYAQNRRLEAARTLFEKMPEKDVVSWNTMVGAYAQYGHLQEARSLFDKMPQRTTVTWNAMTAGYVQYGLLEEARSMFEKIPHPNAVSWNTMLVAYAQNGDLLKAEDIFSRMAEKDVASWNAMIAAYAQNGQLKGARDLFERMPKRDPVSWNAMITANAQNGQLEEARKMFNEMPRRNLVSWNAMITAYAQDSEEGKEAIVLLGLMDLEGLEPNDITIISVLNVCSSLVALAEGKMVRSSLVQKGFMFHVTVGTALINMYGNCNSLDDAWSVFEQMPERSVVTWNAMVSAYVHSGQNKDAFMLYGIMNLEGVRPNEVTFVSALDACGSLVDLKEGKTIHAIVTSSGYLQDVVVGTSLVNMYGKCGCLEEASMNFHNMPARNEVTWNSMITIYAQYGHGQEVHELFRLMHLEGERPTEITLISVLSAFSHAGLFQDACDYFESIMPDYRNVLTLDHYVCMIDILGRVGWLNQAEDLINFMPYEPNSLSWMTLLGACKLHGDVERGAVAAENVFKLDPGNPAPYILLSNIYSADKKLQMESSNMLSLTMNKCIQSPLLGGV